MYEAEIAGATAAHRQLLDVLSRLTDEVARRPSRLPGWTVGHVVTHVARNADSFCRALDAAARGELGEQYPAGPEGRVADIEAGAGRSAAALVDDVARTTTALERAWSQTPDAVWRAGRAQTISGPPYPLTEVPFRRWREVEVHTSDLGLHPGAPWTPWSDGYLIREIDQSLPGLADRLPPGTSVRLTILDDGQVIHVPLPDPEALSCRVTRGELVAWLLGRAEVAELPPLPAWPSRQASR